MKIAYLDTIAGISGDMTLGAFLSAGVSLDELSQELRALKLNGYELQTRHIERNGITSLKVDVIISDQPQYHRHLKDIEELIDRSALSESVKNRSKRIFQEVALAEAKVHNTHIEKVHFHEVGALDSLIDIVGVSICIEKLGIQELYSSPVKVGSGGFVQSQHGSLPIPTPATIEILKNYPTVLTDIPYELTTPTGAAIVKALSKGVLAEEKLRIESIGYGAGERNIAELPNILRVFIGELEPDYVVDEIVNIETNIDDMNPEIYPYVIEKLISSGAHDAYLTPVIMKKGRPGVLLSTLIERSKIEQILSVLFRETTTIGVRIHALQRKKLPRTTRSIRTSLGEVKVKVLVIDDKEQLRVEFEECKRIAQENNLPLLEVYKRLERESGIKTL